MKRRPDEAAKMLLQLLCVDAIGELIDALADEEARRLFARLLARANHLRDACSLPSVSPPPSARRT